MTDTSPNSWNHRRMDACFKFAWSDAEGQPIRLPPVGHPIRDALSQPLMSFDRLMRTRFTTIRALVSRGAAIYRDPAGVEHAFAPEIVICEHDGRRRIEAPATVDAVTSFIYRTSHCPFAEVTDAAHFLHAYAIRCGAPEGLFVAFSTAPTAEYREIINSAAGHQTRGRMAIFPKSSLGILLLMIDRTKLIYDLDAAVILHERFE